MKFKILAAAIGLVMSASAMSATVSYSDSFAAKVAELQSFGASPDDLTLSKFNLAGKILDAVTITWGGDLFVGPYGFNINSTPHTGNMTNTSAQDQTFRLWYESEMYASAGAGVPAALATAMASSMLSITTSHATQYTIAANGTGYFGDINVNDSTTVLSSTNASVLSQFVGAGTFTFLLDSLTSQTFVGGGGNINTDIGTYLASNATVVYTYHDDVPPPVSEPATLLLAGMGLVGAFAARRRKAV